MKNFKSLMVLVAMLCMLVIASPSLRAEGGAEAAKPAEAAKAAAPAIAPGEVSSRMQELQDQMDRIQDEMVSLKKQLSVSPTSTQGAQTESTPAAPAGQAGTAAPAAPATPASTQSPLATVLGPINVTGFVDGYYNYNFNHPRTGGTVPGLTGPFLSSFRTFDGPANQFSLNMIELSVNKAPDASNSRLGYNLTFGFGNAMNVVNSANGPQELGFSQYLKEAYLSYLAPVGKGLQIDFGKFVTGAGAEVIETKDNWNYSRGLLFNYAIPFYHFGLRTKYTFNDKFSLTGYAVNGWNNIIGLNTGKTYGASAAWNVTKKVAITENYLGGPQMPGVTSNWRHLSDTVVTYTPTSKLSLMANYDYAQGDKNPIITNPRSAMWQGVAGYVRYAFNEKYALAARYEYFDDRDSFATGTAQVFNEGTFTFERIVAKHLITRWEYRRDMSSRPTFVKGVGLTDHQDTFTGGLIYAFDMKELH